MTIRDLLFRVFDENTHSNAIYRTFFAYMTEFAGGSRCIFDFTLLELMTAGHEGVQHVQERCKVLGLANVFMKLSMQKILENASVDVCKEILKDQHERVGRKLNTEEVQVLIQRGDIDLLRACDHMLGSFIREPPALEYALHHTPSGQRLAMVRYLFEEKKLQNPFWDGFDDMISRVIRWRERSDIGEVFDYFVCKQGYEPVRNTIVNDMIAHYAIDAIIYLTDYFQRRRGAYQRVSYHRGSGLWYPIHSIVQNGPFTEDNDQAAEQMTKLVTTVADAMNGVMTFEFRDIAAYLLLKYDLYEQALSKPNIEIEWKNPAGVITYAINDLLPLQHVVDIDVGKNISLLQETVRHCGGMTEQGKAMWTRHLNLRHWSTSIWQNTPYMYTDEMIEFTCKLIRKEFPSAYSIPAFEYLQQTYHFLPSLSKVVMHGDLELLHWWFNHSEPESYTKQATLYFCGQNPKMTSLIYHNLKNKVQHIKFIGFVHGWWEHNVTLHPVGSFNILSEVDIQGWNQGNIDCLEFLISVGLLKMTTQIMIELGRRSSDDLNAFCYKHAPQPPACMLRPVRPFSIRLLQCLLRRIPRERWTIEYVLELFIVYCRSGRQCIAQIRCLQKEFPDWCRFDVLDSNFRFAENVLAYATFKQPRSFLRKRKMAFI